MSSYNPGDIILEKYEVQSLLGWGAFGEVYLVKHLMLQVSRAIKVLRHDAPGVGSTLFSDAQGRFLLESRLGASLNSPVANPHLLMVHDCHVTDELCLLEMEYASGGSLAARLEQVRATNQPMTVEQAQQVALEVAGGLAALHSIDIIHRDLKPSNILFDEQGHARVADLGLAQVPGGPSQRSQLSVPLPHPGTPGYMSPEQENSGKTLKPPSDIYSLGLVLFEMLTGRNYTFLEPGTRAASLRAEVPPALDDLLAKMLSEAPKDRPWNGEKTEALLKDVVEGRSPVGGRQMAAAAVVLEPAVIEKKVPADDPAKEQARQMAEMNARLDAAEKQALKAAEVARLEKEQREQARSAPEEEKPEPGFLKRNWLAIALVGLALLAGWYFISAQTRAAVPTQAPMQAYTSPPAVNNSGSQVQPTAPPVSTSRPAPVSTTRPTNTPLTPTNTPVTPSSTPITPTITPPPAYQVGSSRSRSADGMLMMYIPGSGNQGFWMDQTHVTNAMFGQFVSATGYRTTAEKSGSSTAYDTVKGESVTTSGANWRHPVGPGSSASGDNPVVQMSLSDANAYCAWAGATLPTQAQWELAAHGTDGRSYPWGNQRPDGSLANFADANLAAFSKADTSVNDGYQFTSPVGHYPGGASPYQLYDMAGNAWQWTSDSHLRGGAWDSPASDLRSIVSYSWGAADPTYSTGFRCASSN